LAYPRENLEKMVLMGQTEQMVLQDLPEIQEQMVNLRMN
jgi:hypothetical protein